MRHGLYAVFATNEAGRPVWAMDRSKRRALAYGRKMRGYVHRMDLPGGSGAWDAPTFRMCSERIADYSK